ncbi:Tigger transposable element-derived protein 4 [Eumeta japonica]|uniref:Tigger transposable element-derived protein 4 n=1 Tax=Eumeta variegata TaxID=151549 RepID=A0A4C1ZPA3_EUMVA|nr:Tigger transposable element-derived protein 4 [Eumeta japonica]
MGKENFECSSSWVQRFRARHNIVAKKVCGEAAGVPEGVTEKWLSHKWPALSEGYTPEEIFNADETGLFYNLIPDKTLKFKGEECKGGKLSKTRITLLVAANMSGSCKRKLLVIGKAKKPRCFKNIHSLPVTYENNTRSWMTSQIFEKWLRSWDAELKSGGNKILLLVDNRPAHPVVSNLKCIKLVFLPPNVTSVLQPMDQRVTKASKTQYRKLQVLQMIQNIENGEDTKSLSVLDANLMILEAWEKVTQTTIANCFCHTDFKDLSPSQAESDDDISLAGMIRSHTDEDDNIPLVQLVAQLQRSSATALRIEIEEFI